MNQIADDDFDLNLKAASELIIPEIYKTEVLPAVKWLQEHLPFSDEELAGLIEVSPEQFSDWKRGEHSLTSEQTETLQNLHGHKSIVVVFQFPARTNNAGFGLSLCATR